MIWKKLQQTIVMEIYNAEGQLVAKQVKPIYKPLLKWSDVAIALSAALIVATLLF